MIGHREYMVWKAHFELEMNNPSRSDFYSMQIAAEVRRTLTHERKIDINKFKIPFDSSERDSDLVPEDEGPRTMHGDRIKLPSERPSRMESHMHRGKGNGEAVEVNRSRPPIARKDNVAQQTAWAKARWAMRLGGRQGD